VVTSRRSWVGRELTGLRPLELTWVSCGVDYPRLVEGRADIVLYGHSNAWDHAPGALLLAESGGRHGTLDGRPYDPRSTERPGLIAAADAATYDAMVQLASQLPRRR
jgi:fructose-1,6-bisphosphatase/inositol monophosphatase family enzyme